MFDSSEYSGEKGGNSLHWKFLSIFPEVGELKEHIKDNGNRR